MTARNRLRTCCLVNAIRKIRTEKSHPKAQSRKEKTGLQVPSLVKRFSEIDPATKLKASSLCSALSENRSVFGRFLGCDSGKSIDISAVGGA
jgi:hypothetical protein